MCEKTNRDAHEDLYEGKIELRVNEFVSKTMELVDKIVEKAMKNVDAKLEIKMKVLEDKLSQMDKVVKNNENVQEE